MGIDVAEEDFFVEDFQLPDAGDAFGVFVEQVVNGRHWKWFSTGRMAATAESRSTSMNNSMNDLNKP